MGRQSARRVHHGLYQDETARLCHWHLPEAHYLESWSDARAYEGTASERAFHAVLQRGGVIGGSSAGASIQSEYMPRGHPLGNLVMMAEGYERGFGFLPGPLGAE